MYCVLKNKELKITGFSKEESQEFAKLINGEWMTEREVAFIHRRDIAHIPGLFTIN